jgi:hypothetical protein
VVVSSPKHHQLKVRASKALIVALLDTTLLGIDGLLIQIGPIHNPAVQWKVSATDTRVEICGFPVREIDASFLRRRQIWQDYGRCRTVSKRRQLVGFSSYRMDIAARRDKERLFSFSLASPLMLASERSI